MSGCSRIRDHLERQRLSVAQTARALGMDARTVAKWAEVRQWRPRATTQPRPSKLDPYKGQIVRWLDTHPYSAQQIVQRLREMGFSGGAVRPPRRLACAPRVGRMKLKAAAHLLQLLPTRAECALTTRQI